LADLISYYYTVFRDSHPYEKLHFFFGLWGNMNLIKF
jgi:hypothetical protein